VRQKKGKEGKASFLKKRSKKLLSIGRPLRAPIADRSQPGDKSFLVLFFKKEHSSCLPFS
jgi:hypothetical protein